MALFRRPNHVKISKNIAIRLCGQTVFILSSSQCVCVVLHTHKQQMGCFSQSLQVVLLPLFTCVGRCWSHLHILISFGHIFLGSFAVYQLDLKRY